MQNEGEIAACDYHAGMTPKQRIQVQNQWRSGVLQVVVATIAFGMGEASPPPTMCVLKSTITLCGVREIYMHEAPLAYLRFRLQILCALSYSHPPRVVLYQAK